MSTKASEVKFFKNIFLLILFKFNLGWPCWQIILPIRAPGATALTNFCNKHTDVAQPMSYSFNPIMKWSTYSHECAYGNMLLKGICACLFFWFEIQISEWIRVGCRHYYNLRQYNVSLRHRQYCLWIFLINMTEKP